MATVDGNVGSSSIATNAEVIGAPRITYAMAGYRQCPEAFRRLPPKLKTPWLSLVVFAGIVSILTLLPGQVDFLGTMYKFGAMLSFTIAQLSLVVLGYEHRDNALVVGCKCAGSDEVLQMWKGCRI